MTQTARERWRGKSAPTALIVLVAVLGFATLYPIVRLVLLAIAPEGQLTLETAARIYGASWFVPTLLNTAIMVGCSSVFAVVIAATLAWANERTDATLGWFGQILPLTPLVVPAVAVALGWVFLASPRVGFLRSFVEGNALLERMIPTIFSFPGLIFVMTLVTVPYVFLLLQTAFRNLDPALEEASLTSGASVTRTLARVSIPALKHALGASVLLGVVVGIAEYAVPAILGTPAGLDILSVRTVRFVTASYPAQLGEGALVGLTMLAGTGLVWIVYFKIAQSGNFAQIGSKPHRGAIMRLGVWRWPIRVVMAGYLVVTAILPIGALVVVAFQPFWTPSIDVSSFGLVHFRRVFDNPQLSESLTNSIQFATMGAIVAVLLVTALTGAAKIGRARSAELGLGIMKIPAAVANVVLGVGFLIAFFGPPFRLGGTVVLLVGAYVIIYLPHASIIGEAATAQVRGELIEASEVSGASGWRTQRRVLTPLTLPGFLAAFALLFAMMAGEVSVSRMLARPGTTVVGFSLIQVYESGGFGSLAVMATLTSTVILVVVTVCLGVSQALRRRW